MSSSCCLCGFLVMSEKLKPINKSELNIKEKLSETFKVELDSTKLKNICCFCEEKLEISWLFYQQIQHNIANSAVVSIKEDAEIIVKNEVGHESSFSQYQNLIDLPTSTDFTCCSEEPEDFGFFMPGYLNQRLSQRVKRQPEKLMYAPEPKKRKIAIIPEIPTEPEKPKRRYIKKGERDFIPQKHGRGIRGLKEKNCFSMLDLFEDEIKRKKFFAVPEVLENLEENPPLWSNYTWRCSECEEIFENLIDLNRHLHKSHRKRHRSTCCQKEFFNYDKFMNHVIEEHHTKLKFCCVICSTYHTTFLDLYKHHKRQHPMHKIYFCLYCGFNFFTGSHLRTHTITKHNRINKALAMREKFSCDNCGWQSYIKQKLNFHMQLHKAQSFFCDQW